MLDSVPHLVGLSRIIASTKVPGPKHLRSDIDLTSRKQIQRPKPLKGNRLRPTNLYKQPRT